MTRGDDGLAEVTDLCITPIDVLCTQWPKSFGVGVLPNRIFTLKTKYRTNEAPTERAGTPPHFEGNQNCQRTMKNRNLYTLTKNYVVCLFFGHFYPNYQNYQIILTLLSNARPFWSSYTPRKGRYCSCWWISIPPRKYFLKARSCFEFILSDPCLCEPRPQIPIYSKITGWCLRRFWPFIVYIAPHWTFLPDSGSQRSGGCASNKDKPSW